MADAQDLHQIEYRHHQTKDLSPFASSMSPDSLRAWDSRIRPWVRHPHADRLSESMCYQVFPSGQAAVAWRYWDERAAERADGTRGRPLVSRVLVGQESVLTPDVAVALCLVGLPDSVGLKPGEAPDGTPLPTVSGDALQAMTRDKTPDLDRHALKQEGLQAVVAAALADPATPLAISIRDVVIQKPLRESVQYPLLWGLRRIAGRLLGQAGRGWSFSTFEPPMGELDPTSLPGIVFRQALDGVPPPPTRWRKEIKVRPFASDALAPGLPYADRIDLAGWLVAEYQKRGGDELDRFIADRCGAERSIYLRLERVHEGLRPIESPVTISEEAGAYVSLSRSRAPKQEVPAPAGASGEPGRDGAHADENRQAATAGPRQPPAQELHHGDLSHQGRATAGEATRPISADLPQLPAGEQDRQAREQDRHGQEPEHTAARPADEVVGLPEARRAESPELQPPMDSSSATGSQHAPPQAGPAEFVPVPGGQQYVEDTPREAVPRLEPIREEGPRGPSGDQVYDDEQDSWHGGYQSAAKDQKMRSLATSKEGMTAPPLGVSGRGEQQPNMAHQSERYPQPPAHATVSQLLRQLELIGNDTEQFNSILRRIFEVGIHPDDHRDRTKSWEIISDINWYNNISRNYEFHLAELASIFAIVVIPGFTDRVAAEGIATWAWSAPPPMIGGLLVAARKHSPDAWNDIMHILEPVLAARWADMYALYDLWDPRRVMQGAAEFGSGDNRRGVLGRFLRH